MKMNKKKKLYFRKFLESFEKRKKIDRKPKEKKDENKLVLMNSLNFRKFKLNPQKKIFFFC